MGESLERYRTERGRVISSPFALVWAESEKVKKGGAEGCSLRFSGRCCTEEGLMKNKVWGGLPAGCEQSQKRER